MAAINNVSTPWEELERVQRPIRAPEKTYPPLKEGQRILGLTDDKFKELYVSYYPIKRFRRAFSF